MAEQSSYSLKGVFVAGCSCDWGCPCNFEAPPTQGFCEGGGIWQVEQGHYRNVPLDGLRFGMFAHSPAALHLGNVTMLALVDDRADARQREALAAMLPTVQPFSIFYSLTSTFLGLHYVPIAVQLEGIRSRVTIPGTLDVALGPRTNPVTGEEEPATLLKPKGFPSPVQELGATAGLGFSSAGLAYDHSGKSGECSSFEYKGS
jgi:hypothetical protein